MNLDDQPTALAPDAGPPRHPRFLSIDVTRGFIMVIMALDHASMAWNAGRSMFEAALPPLAAVSYSSLAQQIAREVTHVCAPGFQLLAGMGLAISVRRRQLAVRGTGCGTGFQPVLPPVENRCHTSLLAFFRRVAGELRISGDMVLRAAVLFFCEWVLLHLAMGGQWFFFMVLCCIGSSMILFSVARFLPAGVIAAASFGILLSAPAYCPDQIIEPTAAGYFRNIWTHIVLARQATRWQVLYPMLPWVGFFGVGWSLGELYHRQPRDRFACLAWAGAGVFLLGVALRWFGGAYGDRLPGGWAGPWSPQFWILAKYPPTPAFSLITLGLVVTALGILRRLDLVSQPARVWRRVAVFGQVALFFYVVHFHVYGAYPVLSDTLQSYSLATTCMVWIAGLLVLWPICAAYARLRRRYRPVLRYF